MSEDEKQAVYDEVDAALTSGAEISPELQARMDAVLKEDFPGMEDVMSLVG